MPATDGAAHWDSASPCPTWWHSHTESANLILSTRHPRVQTPRSVRPDPTRDPRPPARRPSPSRPPWRPPWPPSRPRPGARRRTARRFRSRLEGVMEVLERDPVRLGLLAVAIGAGLLHVDGGRRRVADGG